VNVTDVVTTFVTQMILKRNYATGVSQNKRRNENGRTYMDRRIWTEERITRH